MSDQILKEILQSARIIASVGLSSIREKAVRSWRIPKRERISPRFPSTPPQTEILGEKSYPDLESVPEKIDVVQVFRKPEDVPPVVDERH